MRLLLAAAALLLRGAARAARFELASVLGDNAVLQRDTDTIVWGFASADLVGAPVYGTLVDTLTQATWAVQSAVEADGAWRLAMPRRPGAPSPYNLYISTAPAPAEHKFDGLTLVVSNLVFGDVIFASGQSNMELAFSLVFNATEEAAFADTVGAAVRIFEAAPSVASSTPLDQLARVLVPWSVASSASLPPFSATAWFTAKSLLLSRTGDDARVPLGFAVSTWGGTGIRAWQGPAGNAKCQPLYPFNASQPLLDCSSSSYHAPCNNSMLHNALVNPYMVGPMKVASLVWYQGENDCNPAELASGYYACQLVQLAESWRSGLGSPNASWSTVQLAPWDQSGLATLAEFRSMQASATASIPRSHTAVLVDGGDATSPYGHVHSRNKQLTGRRVAAGILALLYGNATVPTVGPTFASATYGMASQGGSLSVNVSFVPGTVGAGGLVWVPPTVSPWGNSTRCPTEVPHFAPASCGWFEIVGSDQHAYNVTRVEILGVGDGATLRLTADNVPSLVTARGSRFGWADWPVVNVYGQDGAMPVVPWNDYS